jgi:DNA-directed RNA polymerase subunit M/transcription elongation factor TFIIS
MSKKYEQTSDGKFQCLACGHAPYPTKNGLYSHYAAKHGKTKLRRRSRNAKVKGLEEFNKKSDKQLDLEQRAEVKFCPHCGNEIPVAFVFRKKSGVDDEVRNDPGEEV